MLEGSLQNKQDRQETPEDRRGKRDVRRILYQLLR